MLCIGKIIATRGLKGEVKIYPYTNEPEDLNRIKKVFLDEHGKEEYTIEKLNISKGLAFVKFKEVENIDEAEVLKNTLVYIDEESKKLFLGDDSFFYTDIINAEVFDLEGKYLGKVIDVKTLPRHSVFTVLNDSHEWLLPNVKEFVKQVDTENMKITVDLIEGLYDED